MEVKRGSQIDTTWEEDVLARLQANILHQIAGYLSESSCRRLVLNVLKIKDERMPVLCQ
jgi:hypothetical protein